MAKVKINAEIVVILNTLLKTKLTSQKKLNFLVSEKKFFFIYLFMHLLQMGQKERSLLIKYTNEFHDPKKLTSQSVQEKLYSKRPVFQFFFLVSSGKN